MNKTMLEVSVYTTNDGKIAIQAPSGYEDSDTVLISPEQVDALTKWLREAKVELTGNKHV